nr:LysR family transcriptional regulator [Planktotalea sp.]
MTIRLLRTLIAIADVRTFSAAADVVHVTHAAVSQQMQTLEANLGVVLFNRTTRNPELTPLAHEVVRKARRLVADILFREIAQEPMQLIAAFEETKNDPIALLNTRPFIRFDRNAVLGTLIDNWLRSKKLRVCETMELDSPEAIASMVNANLGVSIVPDLAVKPLNRMPLKRLSLGKDAPTRFLGLAYHKDQFKTRVVEEIFTALTDVIISAKANEDQDLNN